MAPRAELALKADRRAMAVGGEAGRADLSVKVDRVPAAPKTARVDRADLVAGGNAAAAAGADGDGATSSFCLRRPRPTNKRSHDG